VNQEEFDLLFAQAKLETEEILAADPSRSFADPTLPIFRLHGMERLEQERLHFEAGNKMSLLAAIRICANHDLVMPEWVALAFIAGYDKVLNCRANSWDAVFGNPYSKGKHLAAMRKKRELSPAVWLAVNDARNQGATVDENLFEQVGKELGLGKTLAAEYYYDWTERTKL
jgi:hypothetical protein